MYSNNNLKNKQKILSNKKDLLKKSERHVVIGFTLICSILLALILFSKFNAPVTTNQYIKGRVVDRIIHFTGRGSKTNQVAKIKLANGDIAYIPYSGQRHGDAIEFEIMRSTVTNATVYKKR